jgi:hypothetical protein
MRRQKIDIRTLRNDSGGVDGSVAGEIMILDVIHVDRFRYTWNLVQITRVSPQAGVLGQTFFIGLEVVVVNRIKTDQSGKQTPVGFGYPISEQITPFRQPVFQLIKGTEQALIGGIISLLGSGESGTVDTIIDRVVNRPVNGVNLRS